MIYLVDANVLSEPTKQTADSRVVAWLNANESNLVVDSIIIGEPANRHSCLAARTQA
jgi:predicted nucleic acid-binding protein